MNSFQNQKIVFFDKYAEHVYYPLGPTTRSVINGQIVIDGKPEVKFYRHQYSTADPKLAAAMVKSPINFENPSSYYVAAECLPQAIADIYPTLQKENRRAICLALIKGGSVEDAKKAISKDLEPKPSDDAPKSPSAQTTCPFCGLPFAGSKNVEATLVLHVQTQHQEKVRENPEWRKMIA